MDVAFSHSSLGYMGKYIPLFGSHLMSYRAIMMRKSFFSVSADILIWKFV